MLAMVLSCVSLGGHQMNNTLPETMKLHVILSQVAVGVSASSDPIRHCIKNISYVDPVWEHSCKRSCITSVNYCSSRNEFENPEDYLSCVCMVNLNCLSSPPNVDDPRSFCVANIEGTDPVWQDSCVTSCENSGNLSYCRSNGLASDEDYLKCVCSIDQNCRPAGSAGHLTSTAATSDPRPYCVTHVDADPVWLDGCKVACTTKSYLNYCKNQGLADTDEEYLNCICGIDQNCRPSVGTDATSTTTLGADETTRRGVSKRTTNTVTTAPTLAAETTEATKKLTKLKRRTTTTIVTETTQLTTEATTSSPKPKKTRRTTAKEGVETTQLTIPDEFDPIPFCVSHIDADAPWVDGCKVACSTASYLEYCASQGLTETNEDYLNCICSIDMNCQPSMDVAKRFVADPADAVSMVEVLSADHAVSYCVEHIDSYLPVDQSYCKKACKSEQARIFCKRRGMTQEKSFLDCVCSIRNNCHAS